MAPTSKCLSGKLNKRITVQEPTEVQDAYGQPQQTWGTYTVRWASFEPLMGRELFNAQQFQANISTRFRLRYDSVTKAITAKMRVSYDGKIYEIVSPPIDTKGEGREIQLMTRQDENG